MPAAAPARARNGFAAIAVSVAASAGIACASEEAVFDAGIPCDGCPEILSVDPPDGSVDVVTNPIIRFETNEHLDDLTVSGSAFELYSGPLSNWLMAYYDPVRRVTTVWPSSSLRENADYVLEAQEGITDRDGRPLAAGAVTRFTTGEDEGDDIPFPERSYDPEIRSIFATECASCHGGASPLAGLSLDTAAGVTATAIGIASDGDSAMDRITPARPGQSYLVYKTLGDPLVSGLAMPCSLDGEAPAEALTETELQAISDWIAGGAPMGP